MNSNERDILHISKFLYFLLVHLYFKGCNCKCQYKFGKRRRRKNLTSKLSNLSNTWLINNRCRCRRIFNCLLSPTICRWIRNRHRNHRLWKKPLHRRPNNNSKCLRKSPRASRTRRKYLRRNQRDSQKCHLKIWSRCWSCRNCIPWYPRNLEWRNFRAYDGRNRSWMVGYRKVVVEIWIGSYQNSSVDADCCWEV